jgi:ABC-2 type transport system ATP-binding protein
LEFSEAASPGSSRSPLGAGKTTMMNVLAGIIQPSTGTIWIDGLDVSAKRMKNRRSIGVMPERECLFDDVSGYEYLVFVSKIFGMDRSRAELRIHELLNLTGLHDDRKQLIESYSHGMKKKLAFAASILHGPKVVLLDEPFKNIDPVSQKSIKNMVLELQNGGVTIVIASHALDLIEGLCTEVAMIDKGKFYVRSKIEGSSRVCYLPR